MDPAHVATQRCEVRGLIVECLGLLGAAGREPDLWQSVHLMKAIKAFDAGAYELSRRDLQRALRPAWQRKKSLKGKHHSLAELRAAFEQSLKV